MNYKETETTIQTEKQESTSSIVIYERVSVCEQIYIAETESNVEL